MSMVDDISEYLVTQGHATAVGTDIFIGEFQDDPDDQIVLTPTQGMPPDSTTALEIPGLQIRVRNSSFSDGFDKVNDIYNELHKTVDTTISGTRYQWIEAQGSPSYLGLAGPDSEGNPRYMFVCNFLLYKDV